MPSSMIFVGLVVLWLLILVPAVARHRQEVARPSVASLSGRVLERPRRRQTLEVDVMDGERARERTIDAVESRTVVTRAEREEPARVPAARPAPARAAGNGGSVAVEERDVAPDLAGYDSYDDSDDDGDLAAYAEDHDDPDRDQDDRGWERPPPRYRPGRGGFDPDAAAVTARARYGFRQRAVLALLVAALISGVVAAVAIPGLWWLHGAVDLSLVGYLVYLRRQVRMEEAIRDRRAARMAGTRRRSAADDPELDEWARRGREEAGPAADEDGWVGAAEGEAAEGENAEEYEDEDELAREEPERVTGTGASLSTATELSDPVEEVALPRLQPAPPPALPAGTALVEADDDDPALHDLDSLARPDYRRAVGE